MPTASTAPLQVSIAGPAGTLSSLWRFAYGSTSVASSGTTCTDTAGRTITVKKSTTLTMIDDGDTPAEAHEASMVGTSPRAIRGFFIDGPTGSRYREDFN